MRNSELDFFEVGGGAYDMGFAIGKRFARVIQAETEALAPQFWHMKDAALRQRDRIAQALPDCLDEIYGRADGAGVDRLLMLFVLAPELYGGTDDCTTVMCRTPRASLFAHNEDSATANLQNVALVRYVYPDFSMIAYTGATRLAGSAFCLNGKGMAFSSNHIFAAGRDMNALSRFVLLRSVINCGSVEEAQDLVSSADVASPFSLNMLELRTGRLCNLEKDLHAVSRTDVAGKYARSNHFLSRPCRRDKVPASSLFRSQKTAELLDALGDDPSLDDLIRTLAYEGNSYDESVFESRAKYPSGICTVATFAASTNGVALVRDHLSNSLFTISLDAKLVSRSPLC